MPARLLNRTGQPAIDVPIDGAAWIDLPMASFDSGDCVREITGTRDNEAARELSASG